MINDLTEIIREIKKAGCMRTVLEKEFGVQPDKLFTCLSPQHTDKHPSMGVYTDKNTNLAFCHCFSCGVNYDVIDLIGIKYSLDVKKDFIQIIKIICDICNIQLPENDGTYVTDIKQYLAACRKNLSTTDYFAGRGLSPKTMRHFGLGFDPARRVITKEGTINIPMAIIPTSDKTYIARSTDPSAPESARYRRFGPTQIFHLKEAVKAERPIFLTEGEIDAMSLYECGFNAAALGGVSNYKEFAELMLNVRPTQKIIIALDNDKPGKEAAEALKNRLSAYNISSCVIQPYGKCKDANEAMLKEKAELIAACEQAQAEAIEETKRKLFDVQLIMGFRNLSQGDKEKVLAFIQTLNPTSDAE